VIDEFVTIPLHALPVGGGILQTLDTGDGVMPTVVEIGDRVPRSLIVVGGYGGTLNPWKDPIDEDKRDIALANLTNM
jgi:hypothetical protein